MRKINILLISMLMIFMSSMLVAGGTVQGIDIDRPIASFGQNVTGIFEFSGNLTLEGAIPTLYNVSIWAGAAGVGSGSTRLCSNTSLSDTYWSCKIDTTTLTDNSSAVFNVTHGNRTDGGGDNGGENQNSSRVNFLIDNSNPQVKFDRLSRTTAEEQDRYVAVCDANDNVDANLNVKINLADPAGVNVTTSSDTENTNVGGGNNSIVFSTADLKREGGFTLYCTATNSNSLSKQNSTTIRIEAEDGVIIAQQIIAKEKASRNMAVPILIGGALLVVIIGSIIVILEAKRKR